MVKAVRQRSHTSESVHSGGYMMMTCQPFSSSLSLCKIQHYRSSFQQDWIHWLTNRRKNMSFSLKQTIGITDISQRWIVSWCHVPCLNDTQDLVLDVRITPRLFKERNVYVSEKPHHHCLHKNPFTGARIMDASWSMNSRLATSRTNWSPLFLTHVSTSYHRQHD